MSKRKIATVQSIRQGQTVYFVDDNVMMDEIFPSQVRRLFIVSCKDKQPLHIRTGKIEIDRIRRNMSWPFPCTFYYSRRRAIRECEQSNKIKEEIRQERARIDFKHGMELIEKYNNIISIKKVPGEVRQMPGYSEEFLQSINGG